MTETKIYLYATVTDSNGVKETLTTEFCKIIENWSTSSPDFFSERVSLAPGEPDDGVTRWDIGLTLNIKYVVGNVFEELLQFATGLALQTKCVFTCGTYDPKKDRYEDVYVIDFSGPVKIDSLFPIETA